MSILSWLKRSCKKPPCSRCGNPEPCDTNLGFMTLYDIRGNGKARLNIGRAVRCKDWMEKMTFITDEMRRVE